MASPPLWTPSTMAGNGSSHHMIDSSVYRIQYSGEMLVMMALAIAKQVMEVLVIAIMVLKVLVISMLVMKVLVFAMMLIKVFMKVMKAANDGIDT